MLEAAGKNLDRSKSLSHSQAVSPPAFSGSVDSHHIGIRVSDGALEAKMPAILEIEQTVWLVPPAGRSMPIYSVYNG